MQQLLVKRYVGVARIAIGVGRDRPASAKFWCNEVENSTLVFARVTIIFTGLSAGHAVARYKEILEAIDEEC
jgi:hypothetical protein